VLPLTSSECDITDASAVERFLSTDDVVINCAASATGAFIDAPIGPRSE
jgi:dTDP-4-dehydrorhamnose reductase